MHEFMIDTGTGSHTDPTLSRAAEWLPVIRRYVEAMPETRGTFRVTDVPGLPNDLTAESIAAVLTAEHLEFLGAWEMPERYEMGVQRKFVNPGYVHAHQYTDCTVRCACGALVAGCYGGDTRTLDDTEHSADCQPYDRLRARADLGEKRHQMIERLARLGWSSEQIGTRVGLHASQVRRHADDYGVDLESIQNEYRAEAAETFVYLVNEYDEGVYDLADAYGVCRRTLVRWGKRYAGYEPLSPSETTERRTAGGDD